MPNEAASIEGEAPNRSLACPKSAGKKAPGMCLLIVAERMFFATAHCEMPSNEVINTRLPKERLLAAFAVDDDDDELD